MESLFPVKEVPVPYPNYTKSGEICTWDSGKHTGYKMIIREDNNKVLSCMTNDYKLVKNEDIYNIASLIIKRKDGNLVDTQIFGDGQRTMWKWRFANIKVRVNKNDFINPEIIIKNSYDGTVGVHAMGGAFRLICSNGMIIGTIVKQFNAKHSIYNKQLDNIEKVIEETIKMTLEVAKENFSEWVSIDIGEDEIIKLFSLFPLEMNEFVAQYMIAQKPNTLWDLYNCATNIISHKMSKHKEATHKVEMSLFPFMKRIAAQA
jgi:hypothetical protein|tara:strand:+ start:595 stop:1377 length:783 start_codon:yes stop_codon:yes gene_type:complete